MDIHNKDIRSFNMSRIKGKRTKPEDIVAKYLFSNGLRYRRNDRNLPGTPDIVLKKYKTVIFVNGCFWHMHEGCKYFVWPDNNAEFWKEKLSTNKERDKRNAQLLLENGWHIITIWECELKPSVAEKNLKHLITELKNNGRKSNDAYV